MEYTKTTAMVMVAAMAMTGCGPSDNGPTYDPSAAARNITSQMAHQQTQETAQLLKELQKLDPTVRSVDFVLEDGQKTIQVGREAADGKLTIWVMPPADYAKMASETNSKMVASGQGGGNPASPNSPASGGYSGGEMLMSAGAGLLAGALMGSMLSNSSGRTASFTSPQTYNSYRQASTSSYRSDQHRQSLRREDEERRRSSPAVGSNTAAMMAAQQANMSGASSAATAANRSSAATSSFANSARSISGAPSPAAAATSVNRSAAFSSPSSSYASRSASTSQAFSSSSVGRSSAGGFSGGASAS